MSLQPFSDIINEGLHAIGKTISTVDTRIKPYAVGNRAGQALFTRHRWSWRSQATSLAAVADQDYVKLPDDFAAMVSVSAPNGSYQVAPVSIARIMEMRQSPVAYSGTGGCWYVCFDGWDRQVNPELLPLPKMDIYPTPTADGTPTLTLQYQRTWRRIRATDPNGIPNIPENAEWALVLKVRSMFEALHFGIEVAGRTEALYEREIDRLIQEDVPQMNHGRMRGGADEWASENRQRPTHVTDVTWT